MIEVKRLNAVEGRESLRALAEVLVDCVQGGASVSFMAPFSKPEAESFFEKVLREVESGDRILLAAYADGKLWWERFKSRFHGSPINRTVPTSPSFW